MTTHHNYFVSVAMAEMLWHPVSIMKNNYILNGKVDFISRLKTDGIFFYYKTSPIIITKHIICTGSKYYIYDNFKKYYSNPKYNFANSMITYGLVSLVEHPFENMFINISTSKKLLFRNIYKGYSTTLFRQITCSILLPINDYYKKLSGDNYISYILASATTTVIVHPIDLVRINMVTGNTINIWSLRKLYAGIHLSLIRNIGHFTITMTIYKLLTQ